MIINYCFCCKKETKNPKYCSKSCCAKISNKIPKRKLERKCSCGKIVRNYKSNLCQDCFIEKQKNKSDFIKNLTINDYIQRDCLKNLHRSSQYAHIRGLNRSWNKDKLMLPCHVCGYSKHVELAHIKSISSFPLTAKLSEVNASDNIIQLCPNCHWEYDNKLITLTFPEQ